MLNHHDSHSAPAIAIDKGAHSPQWGARNKPLDPLMVVGRRAIACRLLEKCLCFDDAKLQRYEGASSGDMVLIKSNEALPWVQGAVFLGRDDLAPHLYVPTNLQADVSIALLDKAIHRKLGEAPVALLPQDSALVPLTDLLSLNRRVITHWIETHC